MLEGGGGIEDVSEPDAVDAPLAFLAVDWLKRRAKELVRVGYGSTGLLVKGCMGCSCSCPLPPVTLDVKVPGAGKSLRVGS